jgi:hypothetical protein
MDNDEDKFEDDLEILDIINFGFPRQIYNSANHFANLDELSLFRRLRFTKNTTLALGRTPRLFHLGVKTVKFFETESLISQSTCRRRVMHTYRF